MSFVGCLECGGTKVIRREEVDFAEAMKYHESTKIRPVGYPFPTSFSVEDILSKIKEGTYKTGQFFLTDIESTGIPEDILYNHCAAENLTRAVCIGGTLIRKIGWKLNTERPRPPTGDIAKEGTRPKGAPSIFGIIKKSYSEIMAPELPPKPVKKNRYSDISDEEIEKELDISDIYGNS